MQYNWHPYIVRKFGHGHRENAIQRERQKLGQCIYKPRKVVSKVLEAKRKAHNRFSCKATEKLTPSWDTIISDFRMPRI